MRNKEKVYEWIDRYNNGTLNGRELEIFLDLMAGSCRIREEVILDKELNAALKEEDILELRKKIRKIYSEGSGLRTVSPKIVLIAATVLILLAFEYIIYYHVRGKNSESKAESKQAIYNDPATRHQPFRNDVVSMDTVSGFPGSGNIKGMDNLQGIAKTYDLVACYQPNRTLETLVGTASRSGEFSMLKPSGSAMFNKTETIWFSWETGITEETTLVIENNKGEIVYESDSNTQQSVMLKASFLGFGLFYFKIMQKDEVIYFGKFTIQ
jgi:hypothetical protein